MNSFIRPLSLIFFALFSCTVLAVDDPQDDIGSQELDQVTCVSQNTQDCIDNVCLTSEDVDCQEKCNTMSQEKCQQQNIE